MAIIINKEENIFSLNTINTSYVFGIDDEGLIRSLYWGRKINHIDDFELIKLEEVSTNDPVYEITPEEYPVYGGLRYKEHCLKVNFNDGTREVKYKFVGYKVEENKLIVSLKDEYYDLEINLNYIIHEKYDLLERYVTVKNNSSEVMEIEKIYSGQFHIPYENLNFRNVHGHWGAEQQMFTQKVGYGKIYIENRRGISTHNHNPYFILDKDASETNGEVFFGALKLSGNFSGIVEQTPYGETLVQLGINPHDFILELKGGEEFKTPAIIAGYTNEGFEKMSHNLHNYGKNELMRDGLRDILYNSWEATEFKVSCDEQIKLAKKAKELGAELFVVDDGWFGERDGIDNGLGDWYVNEKKFPNGLNQLIAAVKDIDMKFGIWFEPEMVNPKSQLYKDHPDWIYNFKTRESDTSRGQYVLNLSKDEVKEFIYNTLDQMLSTYDIDYIKWDANRPISQSDVKKDIWFKHIENLYDIVRKLKEKHPKVYFEACASGGGRIDFGSLEVFDDYWTSDNTDAYDRLTIQDSYSYIYPIKAMRAWVTDCPNFLSKRIIPLEFRLHSAMMGTLGIGCNILKYSKEDDEIAKKLISEYKTIRHIIQEGDFYRLENTSSNDYYLYQYLKENESVVFVFLPQSKIGHRGTRVKLRGLESDKKYTLEYLGKTIEKTGEYLMNYGVDIRLEGDYSSCIIKLK
ncbi:alpha-galactosidase [Clostridium sp. NSJ-49]|uniref:alpha-galactosidase n=1 Tax=Clostridium TaxID=1485 RepID=UPI00164BA157|nr:alpha-galactosidase [Clostridium sp. NSJ-49]MBC5625046.1 alpha-galactosidase [Clostridium sp. NSJ-49]